MLESCSDAIADVQERRLVLQSLESTRRELLTINFDQLDHFAGNVLQVRTSNGSVVVMSTQACLAFTPAQRSVMERHSRIVESPLPLIEGIEGGSARCMLAGIHLPVFRQ